MKKLLLASIGLAAMGTANSASAADLAAKPYTKAPPPIVAPIYDWSGFYIGGNGGWGSAHNCWDIAPLGGILVTDGCSNQSGGLLGGQFGYRWQTNQFVFGLEGQGDWANLSRTRFSILFPAVTEQAKVDGIGLFTGQIGWAWNSALLYFKGGAAVTSNRFSLCDTLTLFCASASSTRWGGTVGVGFEYGFTPNWSVGLEYDHLFMGHANNSFSVADPVLANFLNDRISQDVDMVTVRFNYRFGGYGAPIAARY
jgi:outer membrane immunogenic protein